MAQCKAWKGLSQGGEGGESSPPSEIIEMSWTPCIEGDTPNPGARKEIETVDQLMK